MDEGLRKHFDELRRSRAAQVAARAAYLVALAVYMVWAALSISSVSSVDPLGVVVSWLTSALDGYLVFYLFCVFLLDAFLNRLSMRKMVFGVIAIVLLQYLVINDVTSETQKLELQFFVWLLLAYPRHLELRRALGVVWIAGGIAVIAIMALALVGVVPNNALQGLFGMTRFSLGFVSTDMMSLLACSVAMAWVYCNSTSWNWKKAVVAFALLLATFIATGSIVNVGIAVLQVLVTCLLNQEGKWEWMGETLPKVLYKLGIGLVPAFAILCLIIVPEMAYMPDSALFGVLDSLLGGGLTVGYQLFETYGFNLLGHRIEVYGSLGNSYLYVATAFGLLCLFCLAVLYCLLGMFLERRGDRFMALYVCLLAVHFLTDQVVFSSVYNLAILAIGFYLATGPDAVAYEREASGEDGTAG